MRLDLRPMRALCRRLGEPQERLRPVLIAGTNGKGSVAAMISAGLHAAGARPGLYLSPHLVDVRERFRIGEAEPSPDDLADSLDRVRRGSEQEGEVPTYFEATTAAALDLFARAGCDAAVLEIGLGGRLDATNVVEPALSAVTRIALDHIALLGATLEQIAREKAGILRPGVPAVLAEQEPGAGRSLEAEARRVGAPVVRSGEGARAVAREDGLLDITTPAGEYRALRPALAGRHQRANALHAARCLETMDVRGPGGPGAAVRAAIERCRLPGRLERRAGDPPVLLDGAHNPDAARALRRHLDDEGLRPVLLFACMRDKDARGMLEALLPACREVFFTRIATPRAADPAALAALAAGIAGRPRPFLHADPAEAFALAREAAHDRAATLLCAGSLYLAGAVTSLLEGRSLPRAV